MKILVGCGGLIGLILVAGLLWAVTIGGYSLDDPAIDEQGAWVRSFRQDNPELANSIGQECKAAQSRSPWTRDGAMELFTCIRGKAEAQGYHYQ